MKVDTLKKRAIIVILSVIIVVESLLLHCTTDILADDEFHQYELYIYSNVVNLQPISVFEKDGEYYIEVSKLADLTRSELRDRPTYCYLTQGIWTISLDFNRQLLEDEIQKSDINLYQFDDQKLVPAVELLYYFGATYVNIDIKDKKFYCIMPSYTAWEALNVNYGLSLGSIYSEKEYESVSRVFEVMSEYAMGDGTTPEGYRKRAYNEVSQLDMLSLSGVKEFISSLQEKNKQFLDSNIGRSIANKINNNGMKYSDEEDFIISISNSDIDTDSDENAYDKAKDNIGKVGLLTKGHLVLAKYLYSNQGNWLREAVGKKHSNDALNATLDKIKKENTKASLSVAAASAILNMASSSINEMKAVQSSNNLIGSVMGRDDLDSLGIDLDTSWIETAKKYNSNSGIITSNIIRAIIEQAIDEVTDKGLDILFEEAGTAAQIGLVAGRKLMNKIPFSGSGYEESKADLSAIILCDLQIELLKIIARYNECIDFSNEDDVEKLLNASAMYCRTTIAMYQEMSKANKNSKKKQELYQSKIDSAAVSLYKIMTFSEDGTNHAIPRYYSELKEEINSTKASWLITDEAQDPTDASLILDLYNKTIDDYDRLMQKGAQECYEKGFDENPSSRNTYYAIVDIDNNGIDELILRYDYPNQQHLTNHDSGYGETTFVYTVTGGTLTKIISPDNEGYNSEIVHKSFIRIYKGSNLINNGMQHTPIDHAFYRYQEGKISSKPVLELTMGGMDPGIWLINQDKVSMEECTEAYNRAINGDEGYELQLYERQVDTQEKAGNEAAPIEEYKKFIKSHDEGNYYLIYDVDKDGYPELMINRTVPEDKCTVYDVYTYKNEAFKFLLTPVNGYNHGPAAFASYPDGNGIVEHVAGKGKEYVSIETWVEGAYDSETVWMEEATADTWRYYTDEYDELYSNSELGRPYYNHQYYQGENYNPYFEGSYLLAHNAMDNFTAVYEAFGVEEETTAPSDNNDNTFMGISPLNPGVEISTASNGNTYRIRYESTEKSDEYVGLNLYVNDISESYSLDAVYYPSIENVYVTDIDINDSYCNIVVVIYGEDDDSSTYIFAFNDNEMHLITEFHGRLVPESVDGGGNALLVYWIGMGIRDYGSFTVRPEISVHDLSAELVQLHSGRSIYSETGSTYEEEYIIPLYSDLTVYAEPSCISIKDTISAGNSVKCEYVDYVKYDGAFYITCGEISGYVTSSMLKASCSDIFFVG